MYGVYAPSSKRLSILQTPCRKNQQARDGFPQDRLESLRHGHRSMAFLLLLYMVGLYPEAVTTSAAPYDT